MATYLSVYIIHILYLKDSNHDKCMLQQFLAFFVLAQIHFGHQITWQTSELILQISAEQAPSLAPVTSK